MTIRVYLYFVFASVAKSRHEIFSPPAPANRLGRPRPPPKFEICISAEITYQAVYTPNS